MKTALTKLWQKLCSAASLKRKRLVIALVIAFCLIGSLEAIGHYQEARDLANTERLYDKNWDGWRFRIRYIVQPGADIASHTYRRSHIYYSLGQSDSEAEAQFKLAPKYHYEVYNFFWFQWAHRLPIDAPDPSHEWMFYYHSIH